MNVNMIANEMEAALSNHEKWLTILSTCVRKKYNYDGCTINYSVDKDNVFFEFQRIGSYDQQRFDLTFEEVESLSREE